MQARRRPLSSRKVATHPQHRVVVRSRGVPLTCAFPVSAGRPMCLAFLDTEEVRGSNPLAPTRKPRSEPYRRYRRRLESGDPGDVPRGTAKEGMMIETTVVKGGCHRDRGDDTVRADPGASDPWYPRGPPPATGSPPPLSAHRGADNLHGTSGHDVIVGRGGNDVIDGTRWQRHDLRRRRAGHAFGWSRGRPFVRWRRARLARRRLRHGPGARRVRL